MARKKKQTPEENQEKMLSFEELKNKVADENGDTDPEVESLLSTLRDIAPEEPETEETPDTDESEEKAQDASGEDYQSIYDDVMRSVMGKTNEETTSRKNRFLADGDQFVDVTEAYQDYGDVREHPEEKPILPVTPVKEAPKTETTAEKRKRIKRLKRRKLLPTTRPQTATKPKRRSRKSSIGRLMKFSKTVFVKFSRTKPTASASGCARSLWICRLWHLSAVRCISACSPCRTGRRKNSTRI